MPPTNITQNGQLQKDDNGLPVMGGTSSADNHTIVNSAIDPITRRLLTDFAGGSGTVTSVSVATANGFAGTVADPTTTPAITLSTTVTGIVKGNGTALSAATDGTDYLSSTTGLKLDQTSSQTIANGQPIQGTLTASQLIATDGSKKFQSLDTATYPSLTEISYVKGVTSSIQTQLNAKGTGTVTNTGGSLTANSVVLGAGTNDVKVVAGIVTDGVSQITLGVDTTTLGKLKMFGNTSGDVTVQPAAVAGTATVQTLPATTGTLVNRVTTANGVSASNSDGALTVSLGAITPTTVNGLTITSSTGTFTLTDGKTFSVLKSITLDGTDSTTMTFPSTSATIARTDAAQTFTGTQTLAENASIGLDPAGSADGKFTGITVTATAGYTQAFGDLVYLDPTDSRWEQCDANSAAGADGDSRGIIGMVVVAGTDGNACTILLNGIIRADAKFPTFTVNNPIYVSETAGAVTQTQPTTTDVVIRVVGFALTADEMYFNPSGDYITHT